MTSYIPDEGGGGGQLPPQAPPLDPPLELAQKLRSESQEDLHLSRSFRPSRFYAVELFSWQYCMLYRMLSPIMLSLVRVHI